MQWWFQSLTEGTRTPIDRLLTVDRSALPASVRAVAVSVLRVIEKSAMRTGIDTLREGLAKLLPLRAGSVQFELAANRSTGSVWIDEGGCLTVALSVLSFEEPPEVDSIRDAKEQEVALGTFANHSPARWLAYLEGTVRASAVIATQRETEARWLMPFEFFSYWEVLDDPAIQSADDFFEALSDPLRLRVLNLVRKEEEWLEDLASCALRDHVSAVRAMIRPAIRLQLERDDLDDSDDATDAASENDDTDAWTSAIGTSRVGGDPDLPASMEWPSVDGSPLVFVAQFALRELTREGVTDELPADGVLSFFYSPFLHGSALRHPVRVLHFSDQSVLVRRQSPMRANRLVAHSVRCRPERQLPVLESCFFYESLLPQEEVTAYYQRLAEANGANPPINHYALGQLIASKSERDFARPAHQLLGHPMSIQGDPYLEIELQVQSAAQQRREGSPVDYFTRTKALRWRLLLQIDAMQDGELLLNQDGGYFYFWIPEDALAVHDWTQAAGALQCH